MPSMPTATRIGISIHLCTSAQSVCAAMSNMSAQHECGVRGSSACEE
jgi:hypothetical protein